MTVGRRTPVTMSLLTGFLGSGKTSLLRRLLKLPDLAGSAVLVNEVGEVGLDHLLLEAIDEDVVLLQSGCICCTIRADLKEAMLRLQARVHRGEIPAFDRLVVETTGLAEPAPIVATLAADPMLRHHFRLGNVVTVVDGVNGVATLDAHTESVKQAAAADRLVISKADLTAADTITQLHRRLQTLNPTAPILLSAEDDPAPAELLLSDIHDEQARAAEVARWLAAEAADGDAHEHEASPHADIRAFCLRAEGPLDWAAFGLWLSMLLNRHGADIMRVKGLLDVAGIDTPVVVHGVQHTIHKPVHLAAWPAGERTTRLVVIARGLDGVLLERSFRAFMRLGGQTTESAYAAVVA